MEWTVPVLVAAAMATALVAGVFLTFSDFVMRSLVAAAPVAGIEAMQMVNRKVYRSIFMVLLLGMVPVAALIAGSGILLVDGATGLWLVAGGFAYLIGVFGVTVFGNVPMNQKLDAMDTDASATAQYWAHYARRWTLLNHVRSGSSAFAAFGFLWAALRMAAGL